MYTHIYSISIPSRPKNRCVRASTSWIPCFSSWDVWRYRKAPISSWRLWAPGWVNGIELASRKQRILRKYGDTQIYLYIYVYMYICVYVYIVYMYICIYCIYVYLYICICIYICIYVYMYMYMHMYVYTVYIYIHDYISILMDRI